MKIRLSIDGRIFCIFGDQFNCMNRLLSVLSFIILVSKSGFAQPGTNDPSFNVADDGSFGNGAGLSISLSCSVIQPDGKILIGGANSHPSFAYNGILQYGISRINTDGSLDGSFNIGTGFNSWTEAIALQSDGKIIAAGQFTACNGINRNKIIRLNIDGSVDTTFNPGLGFPLLGNYISSIAIQTDGKIIVAGRFTSYNGVARSRIVRINPDGSLDPTFIIGTGFTGLSNSGVFSIKLQPDGKIVAVGNFSGYNGTARYGITRLNSNGSLDATFNPGSGFNGEVWDLDIQTDGKIIAVGVFSSYNGSSCSRISRINTNGSIDATFSIGSGFNANISRTVKIQSDGKIVVGGGFYSYNGTNCYYLTRINSDGTIDTVFNTNSGTAISSDVYNLNFQDDGKIIVIGDGSAYNSIVTGHMLRLNGDGNLDSTFNKGTGFDTYVETTSIQPDGKILFGGGFTTYYEILQNRITRLNSDGGLDFTFNSGSGFNDYVRKICLQNDGKIIVGGGFTTFNGVACMRIARLNPDGTLDITFNPGSGFNNEVSAICIQGDGKIIVGGGFTTFNGLSHYNIVRLNVDGSLDSTFSSNSNYGIKSISIQSDGKIIVGGNLTYYNGNTVYKIIRINTDGSLDQSFNPGSGSTNGSIYSTIIQEDGKIIVGGNFTTFNGLSRNRIVRLNSNGSLDATFNVGSGFDGDVRTISIDEDGKIIIGGNFTTFNGLAKKGIVRLNSNGSLDGTFVSGSGFNDEVISTAIQADERIIAAGRFYDYNGTPRNRIARLLNCFPSYNSIAASACDNYSLNGQIYISTGIYTQVLTNSSGCDSIITLNLTINHSNDSIFISTCDPYTLNGQTYTSSGIYNQQFTNIFGCDSIITLNLTINTPTYSIMNATACDSFAANGNLYTTSGQYIDTILNAAGCDSIITLNLTITNSTTGTDVQTACDSYTWIDGNTYTSSTSTPTFVLQNAAGCDSIVTLNLTILSDSVIDTQTACDSLVWIDGVTYYLSTNTPTFLLQNAVGCDSIVTLNLTITHSTTGTDVQTACGSYDWIDGNTYTSSTNTPTFVLQNAAGCDSIITLDLTIIPSLPMVIENSFSMPSDANTCTGEAAIDLSGNAPFELDFDNGSQVVTSNGYSLVTNLCSGVHDLHVTDNCGDTLSVPVVIPVDSNYVFNNPFIDSLAQDSLGVTLTNCDIYYAGIDTAYIDSIWANGNTVNVIWNIVDSNGSNLDTTSYLLNNGNGVYWLQLSVFCPFKSTGEYFTVTEAIYFNNGHVSTAGLTDLENKLFEIYPNPTNDQVHINFSGSDAELTVYDMQGKMVLKDQIQNQEIISLQNFERGVYLFDFKNSNGHSVQRVVKQ